MSCGGAIVARMRTEAEAPGLALVVEVTEACFHCGRAFIRSRRWDPESQALAGELPSGPQPPGGHIHRFLRQGGTERFQPRLTSLTYRLPVCIGCRYMLRV
ncbi:hypothetical protein ACWEQC_07510 [Streptomyces shenzhenensis]